METAYSMQTEILKKPLLCMRLRIASQNEYKNVKDSPLKMKKKKLYATNSKSTNDATIYEKTKAAAKEENILKHKWNFKATDN